MTSDVAQAKASLRAILASLTPTELELEYMRVFGEPPREDMTQGDRIARILDDEARVARDIDATADT